MVWLLDPGNKHPLWLVILTGMGIGATAGWAALVRTLFVFLPILAALAVLVLWRVRLRIRIAGALPVFITGLALTAFGSISFTSTSAHAAWTQ
jgi:hypothetical protein